ANRVLLSDFADGQVDRLIVSQGVPQTPLLLNTRMVSIGCTTNLGIPKNTKKLKALFEVIENTVWQLPKI
ncbi:hypothetical protein, partial [Flectobacillus sp. BAB-3569]|uniref:hypothetical protein n=1 Tax=Flectobacillus sp. BAB-3569 TaxID=1509483 RepID=UPI001C3E009E